MGKGKYRTLIEASERGRQQGRPPFAASEAAVEAEPAATCSTCRFWDGLLSDAGRCRRYPPTPLVGAGVQQPATRSLDWCGEHQPGLTGGL